LQRGKGLVVVEPQRPPEVGRDVLGRHRAERHLEAVQQAIKPIARPEPLTGASPGGKLIQDPVSQLAAQANDDDLWQAERPVQSDGVRELGPLIVAVHPEDVEPVLLDVSEALLLAGTLLRVVGQLWHTRMCVAA
jgi:hypothetical protein